MSLTADEAESEPEDTARETIETKAQETSSTATNSKQQTGARGLWETAGSSVSGAQTAGGGTGKEIRRIWALNALLLKTNEMGIKICD